MGIVNPIHLAFVAIVALLVLGPKRFPELTRALGHGMREFRQAMSMASLHVDDPPAPIQPMAAAYVPAPEPAAYAPVPEPAVYAPVPEPAPYMPVPEPAATVVADQPAAPVDAMSDDAVPAGAQQPAADADAAAA